MYTKFVIVCDDDINARDWKDVIWAITTRMDPARDTTLIEHTPIDYLDFASPVSGLGSKMGLDATNKWPGRPIAVGPAHRPGRGGQAEDRCPLGRAEHSRLKTGGRPDGPCRLAGCKRLMPFELNWVCSTDLTTLLVASPQ